MKWLIACEMSGVLRRALRARGHEAWSCDLEPSEDGSAYHIQGNVLALLQSKYQWEAMAGFPPCTHLCVSGARHFQAKRADGRQQEAVEFFMALINAPIPRIAIENPIGIMSSEYRKPDQVIQPWQHGHGECKATCLWLKHLPLLPVSKYVEERDNRIHRMPPHKDRSRERSRTYQGIAECMADTWSNLNEILLQVPLL